MSLGPKVSELNRHAIWPAIIAGGVALVGAGMSAYGSSQDRKANEKNEDRRWDEYVIDNQSRREAVITERAEREALADRKYDAAMQDWNIRSGALDEMIGMWKNFETDPTSVPAWRAFNEAMVGQAKKSMKGLSGQMERAGRTGGAQDRMRQDVGQALLSKLGNEMLNIQDQARGKQLELEGQRQPTPFLEYYGDPELTVAGTQMPGYNPQATTPMDLSGLGMAAAMLMQDKDKNAGTTGTTVNVGTGSVPPAGGPFGGWEEYSKNTPTSFYQSPSQNVLRTGGGR